MQLRENPAATIALAQALYVEDAGVDIRRIPLREDICVPILAALQHAIRVVEPRNVCVGLQHIHAKLAGQHRHHMLADVVKVEAHIPKALDSRLRCLASCAERAKTTRMRAPAGPAKALTRLSSVETNSTWRKRIA